MWWQALLRTPDLSEMFLSFSAKNVQNIIRTLCAKSEEELLAIEDEENSIDIF